VTALINIYITPRLACVLLAYSLCYRGFFSTAYRSKETNPARWLNIVQLILRKNQSKGSVIYSFASLVNARLCPRCMIGRMDFCGKNQICFLYDSSNNRTSYTGDTLNLFMGSALTRSTSCSYARPSSTPSALSDTTVVSNTPHAQLGTCLSSSQSVKPKASVNPIASGKSSKHSRATAARRSRTGS
jgi:hypothetical protein